MKVITLPTLNKEARPPLQLTEVLDLHDLEEGLDRETEFSLDFLDDLGLDQLEED